MLPRPMSVDSSYNFRSRGRGKQHTLMMKASPAIHATAAVFLAIALAVYKSRAVVVGKVDAVIVSGVDIVISK